MDSIESGGIYPLQLILATLSPRRSCPNWILRSLFLVTKPTEIGIGVFLTRLEQKIGEQKIDVVLNVLALKYRLPIYEIAIKEGIRLV